MDRVEEIVPCGMCDGPHRIKECSDFKKYSEMLGFKDK